jgi:GNAT superfamily N-acetyltransferase
MTTTIRSTVVGFALCFFAYSTWKGRTLYLEDLYVQPAARGQGVGKRLITRCARYAHENGCARLSWVALDWNKPAREFYAKLGATAMPDWIPYRFDAAGLAKMMQQQQQTAAEKKE